MDDNLRRGLSEGIERQKVAALTSAVTIDAAPTEPLTIDAIRKAMLKRRPRETWLSSCLFPADKAFEVEGSGEKFTCAHPAFWSRVEDALRRAAIPATTANGPGLNMTPVEIDAWPEDNPETAEWRAGHWERLREAVDVALVAVPDWLRKR